MSDKQEVVHHKHDHEDEHEHSHKTHTHGVVDPGILSNERGIWAIKWSFAGLFITAIFQIVVVYFSQSVALLADTIHNVGDAATAIPLWIAFRFAQKKPTKRFTYGYGKIEDLAGVVIVLIILFSAILAMYTSIDRFIHPQKISYLWAVVAASIIGFAGNELVALFRIKVGKEIGSTALIADGYHARVDGLTSLAVLFGAIGVWLGFPLADPIIGVVISLTIFKIVWDSAKEVFSRLLDGVSPEMVDEIRHILGHIPEVKGIGEVRLRWLGHWLHAEVNIAVNTDLSVEKGHKIAKEVRHQLLHNLKYLANAVIHVDPKNALGEKYHTIEQHKHDDLPVHSH